MEMNNYYALLKKYNPKFKFDKETTEEISSLNDLFSDSVRVVDTIKKFLCVLQDVSEEMDKESTIIIKKSSISIIGKYLPLTFLKKEHVVCTASGARLGLPGSGHARYFALSTAS
jgi:hypothetical protein